MQHQRATADYRSEVAVPRQRPVQWKSDPPSTQPIASFPGRQISPRDGKAVRAELRSPGQQRKGPQLSPYVDPCKMAVDGRAADENDRPITVRTRAWAAQS